LRLPASCAIGDALIDQGPNAFELNRRDDRSNVDGLVERRANTKRLHAGTDLAVKRLGDALLHQQARAGAADLSLVEPDAIDQTFDGGVQIGIIEDDEWR